MFLNELLYINGSQLLGSRHLVYGSGGPVESPSDLFNFASSSTHDHFLTLLGELHIGLPATLATSV